MCMHQAQQGRLWLEYVSVCSRPAVHGNPALFNNLQPCSCNLVAQASSVACHVAFNHARMRPSSMPWRCCPATVFAHREGCADRGRAPAGSGSRSAKLRKGATACRPAAASPARSLSRPGRRGAPASSPVTASSSGAAAAGCARSRRLSGCACQVGAARMLPALADAWNRTTAAATSGAAVAPPARSACSVGCYLLANNHQCCLLVSLHAWQTLACC